MLLDVGHANTRRGVGTVTNLKIKDIEHAKVLPDD